MEIEKLLDTKEKRQAVVSSLRVLYASEGWKFIQSVLLHNVKQLQVLINDTDSDRNDKENWRLKVKREFQEQLVNLPEKFAKDLGNSSGTDWKELDPYD